MTGKDGLSIIIPIYNSEKYLKKCIVSVLNQSYEQIEVILVDDGSTDKSCEICEIYKKEDNRIKLIVQPNKGLICARTTGIKNASYDLIGFVDSDDWIDKNMYASLMEKMQCYDCDIVSSGIVREYEADGRSEYILDCYEEGFYNDLQQDIYPSMLWYKETREQGLYCNLVNKILKKSILESVYDEIDSSVFYGEDALTLYSYMMKCRSIYICRSSYYHYCIRKGSMSRGMDERLVINSYYLYKGLENAFESCNNDAGKFMLLKQLKNYMLQVEDHVLRQMYNINTNRLLIKDKSYVFLTNKKVVIYGAGDYGQMIYQYLIREVNCEITGWVDKYPEEKDRKCGYKIKSSEDITNMSYDYVVIAVKNKNVADDIKNELLHKYRIAENMLIWEEIHAESIFKDVYLL